MKQEVDPELTVQRKYSSSFARWRLGKLSIGPKLITTILRSLCSGRDSTWCLGCVVAVGAQAARLCTAVGTRLGSAFAHIHTSSSEARCTNHIGPLGRRADRNLQTSAVAAFTAYMPEMRHDDGATQQEDDDNAFDYHTPFVRGRVWPRPVLVANETTECPW
jgi:hypothetical protein